MLLSDHPADDDTSSSPSCMTQSGSTFTTSTADIPTAPDAVADKCSPTHEVTQDFVPDLATTGIGASIMAYNSILTCKFYRLTQEQEYMTLHKPIQIQMKCK